MSYVHSIETAQAKPQGKQMEKLSNAEAIKLAFEYGKARDSKAFGKLFMRTTLKYAELFSHYAKGAGFDARMY